MDNIYIDRFLLLAFAVCILSRIYSHCIRNCTFWYFLVIVDTFVLWRKYFQSLLIFMMFFYPETIYFHNWGIVGNVLLVDLQYTLSFKWPDFDLKCLVTITLESKSLTFKASVWNFPISESGKNYNSLFKLVDNNWVIIMEQKRKIEYSWECTFRASKFFSECRTFS